MEDRSPERVARRLRVKEGARVGIRAVPAEPDPNLFPVVPFACDLKYTMDSECACCKITCRRAF